MTMDWDNIVAELENYEFGVKYIIPTEYQPLAERPDALTDELDNILHARTYLERQLRLYPQEQAWTIYLPRLEATDNLLRAKREVILKFVPDFARGRTRLRQIPPETYWWWYLDAPTVAEMEEQIVYVAPDQLGLTFTEAIIAQVGLRAGQWVKVTAADAKHILISIQE